MNKTKIITLLLISMALINIAMAVSDTVRDSTLSELKEEDKREYIFGVIERVNKITESKAVEEMDDQLKREVNIKLAAVIGNAENTDYKTLMKEIDAIEETYGIQYRTRLLSGRNAIIGIIAAAFLLIAGRAIRKKAKKSKWLAEKKVPKILRSEKKKVNDIKELLDKKESLIKENAAISSQLAGEIEFFIQLVDILKKTSHFQNFKDWGALFRMKNLTEGEIAIIKDILSKENPKIIIK